MTDSEWLLQLMGDWDFTIPRGAFEEIINAIELATKTPPPDTARPGAEIRLNEDGTLDEVVSPHVHLEQMDTNHWWMGLDYPGGRVTVNFHARGKITANTERERQ